MLNHHRQNLRAFSSRLFVWVGVAQFVLFTSAIAVFAPAYAAEQMESKTEEAIMCNKSVSSISSIISTAEKMRPKSGVSASLSDVESALSTHIGSRVDISDIEAGSISLNYSILRNEQGITIDKEFPEYSILVFMSADSCVLKILAKGK